MFDAPIGESAEYVDCFVAFLDILGMSKLIEPTEDAPERVNEIAETLRLIAQLRSTPVTWRTTNLETGDVKERTWDTQIRTFSDNVAIFVPVNSGRLNDVIQFSVFFHDSLLAKGFPVRGAITVGKMYWDPRWTTQSEGRTAAESFSTSIPKVTFGPGLVDAYELESKVAVYPRIIASPSLMELLQKQPETQLQVQAFDPMAISQTLSEPLFTYSDVQKLLRNDFDGIPHVDAFNIRSRTEVTGTRDERGRVQKESIMVRSISKRDYLYLMREPIVVLQTDVKVLSVRAKLIWLAKYFNQSLDSEEGIEPIAVSWGEPDGQR